MTNIKRKMKILVEGILGALTLGVTVLLSPFLRPWYRGWGATQAELVGSARSIWQVMCGNGLTTGIRTHITPACRFP